MSVVTVSILSDGKRMDPTYEILSIDITKEVNRIPYAQLMLIDGDAAQQQFKISNASFFEPGRMIEIKLRYEDDPSSEATVFKGVVVGHAVEADGQGSLLTVELKDAAVRLTFTRKSAVYRDQTDDQIIGQIVANHGLQKGAFVATAAKHVELVQYYCTDWDFIAARADVSGRLVVVDDGRISLQALAVEGRAKQTFTYGISEIFSFELQADADQQYPSITSVAWDSKNQKLTSAVHAKETSLAPGNLSGGRVAKAVGAEPYRLTSTVSLQTQELHAWADATLARSRLALLRGRFAIAGTSNLKLLDVVEIAGIGKRFNGIALVTGVRHRVNQDGWQTDVQLGLAAERFAERPNVVDAPAAGLLPGVNGLQIGIVDAFAEDPEKAFRVKVRLPGVDEKNSAIWARLATPDAGKERGYFFRPEPGDEVVVGFFNDDPRQAVILGALYGAKNTPPRSLAKLTKENKEKAIVSKKGSIIRFLDDEKAKIFIETPGANQLLLDDDAQMIQIQDQYGNQIILNRYGIEIKSAKDLKINASGNVEIKGQKVDVK